MTVTEHPYVPARAARGGRRRQRRTGDDASCTPADLAESDRVEVDLVEVDLVEVDLVEVDLVEVDLVESDRVEVDHLISDLAALVDAGLVVVRPHVFGPARYEAATDLGGAT